VNEPIDTTQGRWSVRRAHRGDFDAILDLRLAVQDLHHRAEPWRFRPAARDRLEEEVLGQMRDRRRQYLVATGADGEVAGYLCMRFVGSSENSVTHALSYVALEEVSVVSKHQRQGVARALCEEAARCARQKGLMVLRLGVAQFNEEAVAAYRALGYQTISQTMEIVLPDE